LRITGKKWDVVNCWIISGRTVIVKGKTLWEGYFSKVGHNMWYIPTFFEFNNFGGINLGIGEFRDLGIVCILSI